MEIINLYAMEKKKRAFHELVDNYFSVVKRHPISDEEYWQDFKPGKSLVLDGYVGRDCFDTSFYFKEPIEFVNKQGSIRYFKASEQGKEEFIPDFIKERLEDLISKGEARKACITITMSEEAIPHKSAKLDNQKETDHV